MKKHTPGPWVINEYYSVKTPNGRDLRLTGVALACGRISDSDECYANTRLIAAAPELLESLKECVCALETCGKDYRATELARSAIAKATGEPQ